MKVKAGAAGDAPEQKRRSRRRAWRQCDMTTNCARHICASIHCKRRAAGESTRRDRHLRLHPVIAFVTVTASAFENNRSFPDCSVSSTDDVRPRPPENTEFVGQCHCADDAVRAVSAWGTAGVIADHPLSPWSRWSP